MAHESYMFKHLLERLVQNHNVPTKKQNRILLDQLLKKYSSGPAVPFVSMIIFENQFLWK